MVFHDREMASNFDLTSVHTTSSTIQSLINYVSAIDFFCSAMLAKTKLVIDNFLCMEEVIYITHFAVASNILTDVLFCSSCFDKLCPTLACFV